MAPRLQARERRVMRPRRNSFWVLMACIALRTIFSTA